MSTAVAGRTTVPLASDRKSFPAMSIYMCHLTSLRNDGRRPDRFLATGQPVISVDTKKKELVAPFTL